MGVIQPKRGMMLKMGDRVYMVLGSAREVLGMTDLKDVWAVIDSEYPNALPILRDTRWCQACEKVGKGESPRPPGRDER